VVLLAAAAAALLLRRPRRSGHQPDARPEASNEPPTIKAVPDPRVSPQVRSPDGGRAPAEPPHLEVRARSDPRPKTDQVKLVP
jgi:hypothetical protein